LILDSFLSYLWVSRGYGLSRGSRYRQIDTIQDEIRRLDNQKEVSIEEIKLILIKFISRTGNDIKKIEKLKRLKRKINDGKEQEIKAQREKEFNLLESTGLEAPNFTNSKHLETWLQWDGEFDSMLKLKTKLWTNKRLQITKDDIEKYISTIEETNGESESESEESEME